MYVLSHYDLERCKNFHTIGEEGENQLCTYIGEDEIIPASSAFLFKQHAFMFSSFSGTKESSKIKIDHRAKL